MSIPDENDPVFDTILRARVHLLFKMAFLGHMAIHQKVVDASTWCATAATDGRHFYYNREFVKSLKFDQLVFLLGHEVLHGIHDHLGRRGNRDPKIWNMATDFVINDCLKKEGVGKPPQGALLDPQYNDEMTSEQVYELLKERSVTIRLPLDQHLDLANGTIDDGSDAGSVSVTVLGKNGPPKLSQDDLDKIRNEIRAHTIQACQALADADKVPAGILRLVDTLTQPKMDWRAMLDTHIRSSVKDDYTFQRISRRSWSSQCILPGMNYRDTISICCAIDTSGSMSDEMLRDFLSEVKGIMETFGEFELWLWTFDTKVYNPQLFTADNIGDIFNYKPQGGGGTLFECNWEYMKEEGLEPPKFVMFTDGMPGQTWGDDNYVDTLFIIHGTHAIASRITAPFGQTAYFESSE